MEDKGIHNKNIDVIFLQYFFKKSMIFTFVLAATDPDIEIIMEPTQSKKNILSCLYLNV